MKNTYFFLNKIPNYTKSLIRISIFIKWSARKQYQIKNRFCDLMKEKTTIKSGYQEWLIDFWTNYMKCKTSLFILMKPKPWTISNENKYFYFNQQYVN